MITRYSHRTLTWIDLESPTSEEVRELMDEFSLDPLFAEELLAPSSRPKVEVSGSFLYLVLHFPALSRGGSDARDREIDFLVSEHVIITTHYESIDSLHEFSKVFEVSSMLDKSSLGDHAGMVLYFMLQRAYKMLQHELEYVHDKLDESERSVFDGKEREMVAVLSAIGRDVLNVRQALAQHKEILTSLKEPALALFGERFGVQYRSLMSMYAFVHNLLQLNTNTLSELRETNTALLYTKQNEIMKTLTIMAFVTFPLTLIAGVFGMNTTDTPLVGYAHDFWTIMSIMLLATALMFWYFKHNRWL